MEEIRKGGLIGEMTQVVPEAVAPFAPVEDGWLYGQATDDIYSPDQLRMVSNAGVTAQQRSNMSGNFQNKPDANGVSTVPTADQFAAAGYSLTGNEPAAFRNGPPGGDFDSYKWMPHMGGWVGGKSVGFAEGPSFSSGLGPRDWAAARRVTDTGRSGWTTGAGDWAPFMREDDATTFGWSIDYEAAKEAGLEGGYQLDSVFGHEHDDAIRMLGSKGYNPFYDRFNQNPELKRIADRYLKYNHQPERFQYDNTAFDKRVEDNVADYLYGMLNTKENMDYRRGVLRNYDRWVSESMDGNYNRVYGTRMTESLFDKLGLKDMGLEYRQTSRDRLMNQVNQASPDRAGSFLESYVTDKKQAEQRKGVGSMFAAYLEERENG